MLMILRIDPRSDLSPKRRRVLSLRKKINIQDPRQSNLMLDRPILVEVVIEAVFVVGDGADH